MFKKAISKLKKAASKSPPKVPPAPRILTAEGWKRLMMKKYRKS